MTSDLFFPSRPVVLAAGRSPRFRSWVSALEDLGIGVHEADDYADALRLLREEVIYLVLAEHPFPETDVADLVLLVREQRGEVPVIVLTEEDITPLAVSMITGLAWVLPFEAAPTQLEPALRALIRRRSREQQSLRLVEELKSRVRVHEGFARTTRRWLSELFHDLRTPIGIVQGYASNLLSGVDGELAPPQSGALERIKAATVLMMQILETAQERLPRESSATRRFDPRSGGRRHLRLDDLCREIVTLFGRSGEEKGVAIRVELADDVPQIWGDRARLSQLLINLVSNALRYTAAGGEIVLKVELDQDQAVLSICDSGAGIAPDDLASIFETGWSSEGRTGLGLAICRQVAREHGAELVVESEVGVGTIFRLVLPTDARTGKPGGELKLGVIDDPILAGQLLMELKSRGIRPQIERPQDMEVLAVELVRGRATLILAGPPDESLRRALSLLEGEP